jgi:hypothetical protein
MTARAATPAARSTGILELQRDDGPLARALGTALGSAVPLRPFALVVAGAVPLLAVLAIEGDGASNTAAAAVIGWLVLAAGVSSGRPHTDPLRWAVTPVLRLAEYAGLLWIAALAGASALPAAFALLAAIAFRQYDIVYRPRYQGVPVPRWVGDIAGGWDGRLLAGLVLLLADAVAPGFFVIAAFLGVIFVTEAALSWARQGRTRSAVAYEDEEEEDQ